MLRQAQHDKAEDANVIAISMETINAAWPFEKVRK
jgi:hypothetical protein